MRVRRRNILRKGLPLGAVLAALALGGVVALGGAVAFGQAMPAAGTSEQQGGEVARAVAMEVRGEASVIGAEVRVRQLGRWARADAGFFAGVADLVVARFEPGQRQIRVPMSALRETLDAAGIGGGEVTLRGAGEVVVTRLDSGAAHAMVPNVPEPKDLDDFLRRAGAPEANTIPAAPARHDEAAVLQELRGETPPEANARGGGPAIAATAVRGEGARPASTTAKRAKRVSPPIEEQPAERLATDREGPSREGPASEQHAAEQYAAPISLDPTGPRTLREALVRDLANRLGIPERDVELSFDPVHERVLRLGAPAFSWSIVPRRAANLGAVSWSVTLRAELPPTGQAGEEAAAQVAAAKSFTRQVEVTGQARAWWMRTLAKSALTQGQLIREGDVEEKRMLLDRLPDEAGVTREQALMMQAGRPIPPGTVLGMRMLDPVLLVKSGQVVTVVVTRGAFEIRTVGRAMEGGAYGMMIRVRNEETNDVLQATITGMQEVRAGAAGPQTVAAGGRL